MTTTAKNSRAERHEPSLFDVVFRVAGAEGFLHALDLDTLHVIEHRADTPVVSASVFKVPVLVECFRQVEAGELDPSMPVTIPAAGRVASPYGLSQMRDEVTISVRDLATLMISISDNVATDCLCEIVGLDRVAALLARLGLTGTAVPLDCAGIFETMCVDGGCQTLEELEERLDHETAARLRALDASATNRTTAREATRLLQMIWADEAASPKACAEVRRVLGLQVWPHRLAAGFPEPGVKLSGKTGTLPQVRNEIGVIEYPTRERYAVAVFTRSWSLAAVQPQVDAVIGTAARVSVELLRRQR